MAMCSGGEQSTHHVGKYVREKADDMMRERRRPRMEACPHQTTPGAKVEGVGI